MSKRLDPNQVQHLIGLIWVQTHLPLNGYINVPSQLIQCIYLCVCSEPEKGMDCSECMHIGSEPKYQFSNDMSEILLTGTLSLNSINRRMRHMPYINYFLSSQLHLNKSSKTGL